MTRSAPNPETVTLHVPFRMVKRGGRKEMQLPAGAALPRRTDNTLVKALARALRWKRMLESGEFTTINELAEREGIAPSYMTRVLRLTLLAPDIVETIMGGTQGPEVTLARLLGPFPLEWQKIFYLMDAADPEPPFVACAEKGGRQPLCGRIIQPCMNQFAGAEICDRFTGRGHSSPACRTR
ncbi:hypothetical protein [Primorskyibacter aestuariivivens]